MTTDTAKLRELATLFHHEGIVPMHLNQAADELDRLRAELTMRSLSAAALQKMYDDLRAELSEARKEKALIVEALEKHAALSKRVDELEALLGKVMAVADALEALKEYAAHEEDCDPDVGICVCGLSAILARLGDAL